MNGPYDDIIHLPRHISKTRPPMSINNRAAQFSAFAALTGYESAIKEAGRVTDQRIVLDEYEVAVLDLKLNLILEQIHDHPKISLTYFQPDERKQGGAYVTTVGVVKKIDRYSGTIVLMNHQEIPIRDILDIEE